jgi:hypothetical protein
MASKTAREKDQEDLREVQEASGVRRITHIPTELHVEVPAQSGGGKDKVVEVHAFGGKVYIDSHGEAVLDVTDLHTFVETLKAAQAAAS